MKKTYKTKEANKVKLRKYLSSTNNKSKKDNEINARHSSSSPRK